MRVPPIAVAMQISYKPMAIFYYGQLLMDLDGGPLLAQPNLLGPVHGLERHNDLHHSRLG